MTAQEAIARKIAEKQAEVAQYEAGQEDLKRQFVAFGELKTETLKEIARLQAMLDQLRVGSPTPQVPAPPPLHPLEAAIVQKTQFAAGAPAVYQEIPGANTTASSAPPVRIPAGLGPEDVEMFPQLANLEPRQAYQHMRQDPYGAPSQSTDQMGGVPTDIIPRGAIKDLGLPLISRDQEEGV